MNKSVKGFALYINIMAAVLHQQLTRKEIAERVGIKVDTLNSLLKLMVGAGLIHVHSVTGRCHRKRWGFDGVRHVPVLRSTLLSMAIAWETLSKPATAKQIEIATGLNQGRVYQLVKHARQKKIVHICGYERSSLHHIVAQYISGPGRDAVKPAAKSKQRASMEHRRRDRWGAAWATMINALE